MTVLPFAQALAQDLRADAAILRRRGVEDAARILESVAADAEAKAQAWDEEELTLEEAAAESGYTKGHLRRLISEHRLPYTCTEDDPLILRRDLPRKLPDGLVASDVVSLRRQVARAVANGG